ncbi:MAG TPA: 23S rRNA (pseudouridine(1915)-N(3))-methyltransferase RlmH [Azospira sp.]|nr:23S rRNA (pseudouridine(1915)-N(3))-methyltransferase RlmH [Azospira sp.]
MKLLIAAVGHKMPDWVAAGCNEYIKRMPRELPLSVVEIKPEPRVKNGSKTREQLTGAEKSRIAPAIAGCARIVALDERGRDLSTQQLAQRLEVWMQEGGDTAFLIGGADGLDPELKDGADEMIRLSSLTLPHAMARLVLCEQLYRAVSVIRNHPYHREG